MNNLKATAVEEILAAIEPLVIQLREATSLSEKMEIVSSQPGVEEFIQQDDNIQKITYQLSPEHKYIFKTIIALGQGTILFNQICDRTTTLGRLLEQLLVVERFYDFMGGLAGYYYATLEFIIQNKKSSLEKFSCETGETYENPSLIDISENTPQTRSYIRSGLESLPLIAQIFPVGGAGDRLDLRDEKTNDPLPAAFLSFGGKSLMEGLIRDLQAVEFLYWKIFDQQLITPLAIMTSDEKNNDAHMTQLIQQKGTFGRPSESLRRFVQPLVPVITVEGNFSLSAPLLLKMKPGGHGALWKLAFENGLFEWFDSLGRKKLMVRQINNPIAGTDGGLLAFLGVGCNLKKTFGFYSCDRLINSAEGMIVLAETKGPKSFRYCVKNIEYTGFESKGIKDAPRNAESIFSAFPTNTNILFADIKAVEGVVRKIGLPGLMINMKTKVPYIDESGSMNEVYGGRLESMMQSLAEAIEDEFPDTLDPKRRNNDLSTYVTHGERKKVISVTKNKYFPGKSLKETPEGCFFDQLQNCYDLFTHYCYFNIPPIVSAEEYLKKGPSFIIRYHPALGPLYQVIAQKIKKGRLKEGSELILEIAEVDIENLDLQGSLIVTAKTPLGNLLGNGLLHYSTLNGKCELHNVKVVNKGIDHQVENIYWKNEVKHCEKLEIILHGNAEFYAEDIVFVGDLRIEVPAGCRMKASMQDGQIHYHTEMIHAATWHWQYQFDSDDNIKLSYVTVADIAQQRGNLDS